MAKKLHILVVDDATFTRDLVKKGVKLGYPGFVVHEAANGRQAQAKLTTGGFDLVLCDWEMPEVSGLEVLEWMRADENLAEVPFVMITSRGDREHVVQAVERGATNYIVKPFTNEKLYEVVTRALTKSLGVSAKALKKLGGGETQVQGGDSAAVLAGGLSGDLNIAERLETGAGGSGARKERAVPRDKVIAQVRHSGGTIGCLVKEIDFNQVVVVFKRPERMPNLLEQATFDFTTEEDGRTSRMNAYIHALQAGEKRQDTDILRMTLRFVDDDPEKQDHLGYYFNVIDG
ncbi:MULTISPECIES: response regulator [unclassified Halorhodospira]|uniref:response regulator n=1 Tax=unclassified Halorhodospira TaxID=2626748 RepID=UPI001EE83E41|nr:MULTISPECIES: response regulator [unclassified Halorhodospira]MCG5540507.1 response regulator [Halorhodospira sp. M39old]MCG5544997.1 response regulator [Halorhodospira sp. M38]